MGWGRRSSGVIVTVTYQLMADRRDPGLAGPQVTAPVLLTCGGFTSFGLLPLGRRVPGLAGPRVTAPVLLTCG